MIICCEKGNFSPEEWQALVSVVAQEYDLVTLFEKLPQINSTILTHEYTKGNISFLWYKPHIFFNLVDKNSIAESHLPNFGDIPLKILIISAIAINK